MFISLQYSMSAQQYVLLCRYSEFQILLRGTCAVASKEVICHVSHRRSPERCIGMNESIAVT